MPRTPCAPTPTPVAEELLAHYVMIVKENTKGLFGRLNDLDWTRVPVSHRSVDTGHGRREVRTIQVMDAPADLGFPHAAQVFLIERYTTRTLRKRIKNTPPVQDRPSQDRGRGARDHQPQRPRSSTGASGHLRPRALVHREPAPLGPFSGCHRVSIHGAG